jgi:hypothetical protein
MKTGPPSSRKWRNWQTHQLEGLALARAWGFESPLSHHSTHLTVRVRRTARFAHGGPSDTSNALSERSESKGLRAIFMSNALSELSESKGALLDSYIQQVEGLVLTAPTMASSSDDVGLHPSLLRRHALRWPHQRCRSQTSDAQRRFRWPVHQPPKASQPCVLRAPRVNRRRDFSRASTQTLE